MTSLAPIVHDLEALPPAKLEEAARYVANLKHRWLEERQAIW